VAGGWRLRSRAALLAAKILGDFGVLLGSEALALKVLDLIGAALPDEVLRPPERRSLVRAILRIDAGSSLYQFLDRGERAGANGIVQCSGVRIEPHIRCVGIGAECEGPVDSPLLAAHVTTSVTARRSLVTRNRCSSLRRCSPLGVM
jgi:hypothetical protein